MTEKIEIYKKTFQNKNVLCALLENVVSEFQGKTTSEIMQWVEKATFFPSENIVFLGKHPTIENSKLGVSLHIDAKSQGLPVEMRALCDASKELDRQLEYNNGEPDFSSLGKSYSIWVCLEEETSSIVKCNFQPNIICGTGEVKKEDYDIIETVIIRVGTKTTNTNNEFLGTLENIFAE